MQMKTKKEFVELVSSR